MGSFQFTMEKFGNTIYLQDMSKHARLKLRVAEKPYVLDENMIVELGKSRAYVKSVYPVVLKMKRCIDSFGFKTKDCSFPYKEVFDGKVVISVEYRRSTWTT